MAELLTDDIITDALVDDGIMEEPDAPWLLEYIESEHGGKLDTETTWCDDKHKLKYTLNHQLMAMKYGSVLMKINLMYHKMVITMKITASGQNKLLAS